MGLAADRGRAGSGVQSGDRRGAGPGGQARRDRGAHPQVRLADARRRALRHRGDHRPAPHARAAVRVRRACRATARHWPQRLRGAAVSVLQNVRRKRGYVLTYHRLLNEISPALLAAYDDFYTQFTLTGRALAPVEKETIWMALIAATRAKPSGRIHVVRARKAGMSRRAIADAVAIGAHCDSLEA